MRRVLFGLRSLVGGGVESTALTLHQFMRSPDWRVWLALLEDHGELHERARGMRGLLRPRGGPRTDSQREDLWYAFKAIPRVLGYGCRMRALLKRMHPDILFTHSGVDFLGALRAVRHSPAVWVAGVGSDVLLDLRAKSPRMEGIIRPFLRYLYQGPQWLVTASHGLAKTMHQEHGVPNQRLKVIGNPVDLSRLRQAPAMRPPGLPERFILGVGRLTRVKGFDILVRAVAQLEREIGELPLVLLGEGEERPALAALARQLNFENLHMPGFAAQPWDHMRAALAVVVPSRIEGFSNVTVEAMACSTPVIVTDCPHGPREIITQGRDGVLVATDDVQSLAQAVARLTLQPDVRAHFARQGVLRAQDFDAPIIARQYFEFFDDIFDHRQAQAASSAKNVRPR